MKNQLDINAITLAANDAILVNNISLHIKQGQVLALVGNSGSGKSLTCAAALGVLPSGVKQLSGDVSLNGQAMKPEQLRGHYLMSIMQNPRSAFNPLRSMFEHIQETGVVLNKPCDQEHLVRALSLVGFDEPQKILNLYPFQMSGGMLQRMMIAIAVVSQAPFIIADEPTTDLDMVAQARVLDLLENLLQAYAPGILLVTHDMGVVARLADEVVVIDQGMVVEQGLVHDIFERPQHPVTQALMSAHLALYGLELTK